MLSSDPVTGEDLADLYENAPCGYLSLSADARVVKVNQTLASWLGTSADHLVGKPFHALLSFGGRIAFETHMAPLLRLQGFVHELALDLLDTEGEKLPVIANAAEKRDSSGEHRFTRLTVFKAVDRRTYERGLVAAKAEAEAKAKAEHDIAALREQFIAVLGHDLRNPLMALAAGVRMMMDRENLSDRGQRVAKEMRASIDRAQALIEDVLDFARGKMGEGITLQYDRARPLEPVLEQVAAEMRAIAPDREIITRFSIGLPIACDHARIAQLASNLLGNAITHGAPHLPIEVEAHTSDDEFVLSVANAGAPIPPAARAQLFQPFFRGGVRHSQQGLGLGLFIVDEIAKAHGGSMAVTSSEAETRFTFTMPTQSI